MREATKVVVTGRAEGLRSFSKLKHASTENFFGFDFSEMVSLNNKLILFLMYAYFSSFLSPFLFFFSLPSFHLCGFKSILKAYIIQYFYKSPVINLSCCSEFFLLWPLKFRFCLFPVRNCLLTVYSLCLITKINMLGPFSLTAGNVFKDRNRMFFCQAPICSQGSLNTSG